MQDENNINHPNMDEEAVCVYQSSNSQPRYFIVFGYCPSFIFKLWQTHQDKLYRLVWMAPNAEHLKQSNPQLDTIVKDSRTRIISEQDHQQPDFFLREDITGIGIWGVNIWVTETIKKSSYFNQSLQNIQQIESVAIENASIQYQQGPEIQRNIISNFPYILRSTVLDQWSNQYQNIPALVVGAGPSLDRNLHVLKKAATHPFIICVDTALKLLLQQGIEPDFVVSCDPTILNTRHFKDVRIPQQTVFAFLPEIHRSILPSLQPQNVLCLHDKNSQLLNQLLIKLEIQSVFSRGMNVGFCAYSLAKALGCSPIILCGMDLALEAGKSSHAKGTANASLVEVDEENKMVNLTGNVHTNKTRLREVDGYYGSTVSSFQHFYLVLQRFAQDISTHSIPVINATEGGAKISGTTPLPLVDALSKYAVTSNQKKNYPVSLMRSVFLQECVLQLQSYHKELEQTRQLLERGSFRISQWLVESQTLDAMTIHTQAQSLLKRWQDILHNPVLDVCLDIGLAPMRFDTYRIDPPPLDDPAALTQWWHDWLLSHFHVMLTDTEIYLQLYSHVIQKLIANHPKYL